MIIDRDLRSYACHNLRIDAAGTTKARGSKPSGLWESSQATLCQSGYAVPVHAHFAFDGRMIDQLRGTFNSACEKLECHIIEFDGEEDHVHLLVEYPPKLAISVLVNNLKSTSSRQLRLLNADLPRLSKSSALWSRSYFACSAGGATIETLKAYFQDQKTPD